MNYIIFGGSGFIGSHLVNLLKEENTEAIIYNLDIIENNHNGKSNFIFCDVRKPIVIDFPVTTHDFIFNLSAIHITPSHHYHEYFETNILGAENITTFAEEFKIKRILFTSSIATYGSCENLKVESTLPMPNTPYGVSKLVAEKIHIVWQNKNQHNKQLTILRPGVVFGKGENGNFTRLYWGIKGRKFVYPGRKDTIKSSIYVKELVNFILYRINLEIYNFELYNCVYTPSLSIEQIVNTIIKATNLNRNIFTVPGWILKPAASIIVFFGGKKFGIHPDRVKKLTLSTNICGKKLAKSGYKFKYSFEEAINDWFIDNDKKYLK